MIFSVPNYLTLMLTNRCNLKCNYCHVNEQTELPIETWLSLFSRAGDMGVFSIHLSGGEVLCYPQWREIISSVVANRMRFKIATNGSLWTEEMVSFVAATGRCDSIMLSLDGTEELHDRQRGRGAWRKALNFVDLLRPYPIHLHVRLTAGVAHMGKMSECFQQLFENLSLQDVSVALVRDSEGDLAFTPEEYWLFLKEYAPLYEKYGERISKFGEIYRYHEWCAMKESRLDGGGIFRNCNGGREQLFIHSNGDISMCQFSTEILGNIQRNDIEEIWRSSLFLNEIRQLYGKPLSENPECAECTFLAYCFGRCLAHKRTCLKYF